MTIDEEIRSILAEHGRLTADATQLADGADLYRSGLTSHTTITVMLALEDAFDVEFPQQILRKSTFESIAAIRTALVGLGVDGGRQ
jgi:acyl carrier protein